MAGDQAAPPMGAEPRTTRTTSDLTKAAVSGWLGTAMEFMDFQLYSLAAAIVFNQLFFPNVSPAIGLIAAMATYGVGYVARLAGAIYFGRMGDKIGRKRVLFLTITLMGASTTLIGVLPTYATIGLAAPILLVALRLIQGFGAGAEIAGATVMLVEYAPVKRRGLIAYLLKGADPAASEAAGINPEDQGEVRLRRCGVSRALDWTARQRQGWREGKLTEFDFADLRARRRRSLKAEGSWNRLRAA